MGRLVKAQQFRPGHFKRLPVRAFLQALIEAQQGLGPQPQHLRQRLGKGRVAQVGQQLGQAQGQPQRHALHFVEADVDGGFFLVFGLVGGVQGMGPVVVRRLAGRVIRPQGVIEAGKNAFGVQAAQAQLFAHLGIVAGEVLAGGGQHGFTVAEQIVAQRVETFAQLAVAAQVPAQGLRQRAFEHQLAHQQHVEKREGLQGHQPRQPGGILRRGHGVHVLHVVVQFLFQRLRHGVVGKAQQQMVG